MKSMILVKVQMINNGVLGLGFMWQTNKPLGPFILVEIFSMDVSAINSMLENMVLSKMQMYIL